MRISHTVIASSEILKKIQLVIVRTMRYMRIGIVSSKRRCDGTLVKRNQKLNLELSKKKQKKHAKIQNSSEIVQ